MGAEIEVICRNKSSRDSADRNLELNYTKLMRLDRGRPKIRSKSYSNRLLIDFFNPNSALRSIVPTISIQIRTQIWIRNLKSMTEFDFIFKFISKIIEFDQKLSILVVIFDFFDQIQLFSIKLDNFWYKIEIGIQIWVRIRIEIVATIDRTGKFRSKKLIKSQFEYDLDRISAWPRLDRISLHTIGWSIRFESEL